MKKITQSLLLFYPLPNTHTQKKKKKKKDLHNRTQHTTAHNSTVPPLNPPLTHRLHYSHSKITTFITITKKKISHFLFFSSLALHLRSPIRQLLQIPRRCRTHTPTRIRISIEAHSQFLFLFLFFKFRQTLNLTSIFCV